MGNNINPSVSTENPDTMINMDKKSRNLLKKYKDTIEEMEDQIDDMKMSQIAVEKDVKESYERQDESDVIKDNLRKQFKLGEKLQTIETTIKNMKENREKYSKTYSDLQGFEKYDAIMSMVQDPSISSVLSKILEDEDDDVEAATEQNLSDFDEEEMERWVEEQFQELGK